MRRLKSILAYRPRHGMLILIVGSIASYLFFSKCVVGIAIVNGTSMFPTFRPGEVRVINKWACLFGHPRRGDIVVFRHPEIEGLLVKRVIGLPHDVVRFERSGVCVNGIRIEEPYLAEGEVTTSGALSAAGVMVPAGQFFVLGDNRNDSEDSRYIGMVKKGAIVGKIRVRPARRASPAPAPRSAAGR